jgi:hypothetical protein
MDCKPLGTKRKAFHNVLFDFVPEAALTEDGKLADAPMRA